MTADAAAAERISNAAVIGTVLIVCMGLVVFMATTAPHALSLGIAQLALITIVGVTLVAAPPTTTVGPLSLIAGATIMSYVIRPAQLIMQPETVTYARGLSLSMLPAAVWYASLLAAAFAVGYISPAGRQLAERLRPLRGVNLTSRRAHAVRIALILIVLVGYAALFRVSGMSMVDSLRNPVAFRAATSSQGAFYVSGLTLWCIWAFFYLEVLTPRTSTWARYVVLAATFAACFVLTFPFGSRGFLIIPVLFLVGLAQLRRPGHFGGARLMVLLLFLMAGSGLYGVFRESQAAQVPGGVGSESAIEISDVFARAVGRFDSIDFFTWTLEEYLSTQRDFLYGRSLFDLAVQPLPRAIYPSKPSQTSAWLMEELVPHYDRAFTPEFGLVAELYVNGWIPAIVLGGILFGISMQVMESYVWVNRDNNAVVFWYAGCLTSPLGWLLAGFNSFATVLFAMNLVFCAALFFAIRDRATFVR